MKKITLLVLVSFITLTGLVKAEDKTSLWRDGSNPAGELGSMDVWDASDKLQGWYVINNSAAALEIFATPVEGRLYDPVTNPTDKAVKITVNRNDWYSWHASMRSLSFDDESSNEDYNPFQFTAGKKFGYSFWAKMDEDSFVSNALCASIIDVAADWSVVNLSHSISGNTELSTEWRYFEFEVENPPLPTDKNSIRFNFDGRKLPNGQSVVYIDDVQIFERDESFEVIRIGAEKTVTNQSDLEKDNQTVFGKLIIDSDNIDLSTLLIESGGVVEVNPGKGLKVTDKLINNGSFTLKSDATNGTATLLGDVAAEITMEQYIGSSRSWYMGIPFSSFAFSDGDVKGYDVFTESTRSWNYQLGSPTNAQAGYGMMINPNDGVEKLTLSGEILSGDVVLNDMTSDQERFHFVGNPYPSFMKWSELGRENLDETIWFRTSLDGSLDFATLSGSVSSPEGKVDDNLAPMQGFWVRVEEGKEGKLTFPNAQRTHYEGGLKQLRAPQQNQEEMQIVRLTVTDGTLKDETVIYFDEANSNDRDRLDATKMMSGNRAQIYTQLDGEAIVINAMESIPFNSELPLGFRTPKAGEFTLYANQFQGFEEGLKLILTDHISGNEVDLVKSDYTFTASEGNDKDRFSLSFVPATPTDNISTAAGQGLQLTVNSERQIVLNLAQDPQNATAKVYTVSGQQIASTVLHAKRSVLTPRFDRGVYIVVVDNNGVRSTERIVIN